MAPRIWKETKQEPGTAQPGNMPGFCFVSFHFLWAIMSTSTVNKISKLNVALRNKVGGCVQAMHALTYALKLTIQTFSSDGSIFQNFWNVIILLLNFHTGWFFKWTFFLMGLGGDALPCTVLVLRIAHRKWKETKLQPGTAGPGNMLGSRLVSFHFLSVILSTSTVDLRGLPFMTSALRCRHSRHSKQPL